MVGTLETNQIAIRGCILYEVKLGKGIEEVYKNLCKVMGNNVMEYTEFEYWYYRFYNGNHDLDHDRSLDPKTRQFSDLSNDAIKLIMDRLDLNDRFHLRKVCRKLQDIFDSRSPDCKKIDFTYRNNITYLCIDDGGGIYKKVENGCQIRNQFRVKNQKLKIFEGKDPIEMALNDMFFVMKHPKLQLETFRIVLEVSYGIEEKKKVAEKMLSYMETLFKGLTHKVHIKAVSGRMAALLSILPFLESETLSFIELHGDIEKENHELMHKMFELDQWKKANELRMWKPFFAPIEHFSHFTRVILTLGIKTSEDLVSVRNILQNFRNLESCLVYCKPQLLETTVLWNILDLHEPFKLDSPNIRHFRIANSNDFFEVTYLEYRSVTKNYCLIETPAQIKIERKS